MFRFIHTADLQIGKGFGQFDRDVSSKLSEARLKVVEKIAQLATANAVDAVLVAGDCFDSIGIGGNTLRKFRNAMAEFTGKWLLLPGNHDPLNKGSSLWAQFEKHIPANVILIKEPKPIPIGGAVILPAPLLHKHTSEDLSSWFDTAKTEQSAIRIGLAHGSVTGYLPELDNPNNPIDPNRAKSAALDYLALGDWHGYQKIDQRTYYSGTPEPDRFKDNDPGQVLMVEIAHAGAVPRVEKIPVAQYRWSEQTVDIFPDGVDNLQRVLADSRANEVLKLKLVGTIDLKTDSLCDELCAELKAKVTYLEIDKNGLDIEVKDGDFDNLELSGTTVKRAVTELRAMDNQVARRALSLFYSLYRED